jgi:hypothetical protein
VSLISGGISVYSARFAALQYQLAQQVRQDNINAAARQKKALEDAGEAAKQQAGIMERTAKATEQNAKTTANGLRATLERYQFEQQPFLEITGAKEVWDSGAWFFVVTLKNTGRSAAQSIYGLANYAPYKAISGGFNRYTRILKQQPPFQDIRRAAMASNDVIEVRVDSRPPENPDLVQIFGQVKFEDAVHQLPEDFSTDAIYSEEYFRRTGCTDGKLLEIGCAYGFFLAEAKSYFEVQGIEVSDAGGPRSLGCPRVRSRGGRKTCCC